MCRVTLDMSLTLSGIKTLVCSLQHNTVQWLGYQYYGTLGHTYVCRECS